MSLENETALAVAPEPSMPETDVGADIAPSEGSTEPAFDLDSELSKIYRQHNPDRDEAGRFRGDTVQADATQETEVPPDQSPATEQEQAVTPAIPAPQSWSAEAKAKWATLPPDLQDFVAKRERESHEAITRQGQQIKAYEPIQRVLEQHRDVFERNGVTVDDGISRLLAAQQMLENDPVAAIGTLAQAYGVDLAQFGQRTQPSGNLPPEVAQLHQEIAMLKRQLNDTSTRIATREKAEAETQFQSTQSLIDKFAADKSDWAELEGDILFEINGIKANIAAGNIEKLPPEVILERAYQRAVRNNPEITAKRAEEERKAKEAKAVEDARKRAEAARKANLVNVPAHPTKGAVIKPLDDELREIYRRHNPRG